MAPVFIDGAFRSCASCLSELFSGLPVFHVSCSSVVPAFVVFIDAGICPGDWRATGIGQSG